MTLTRLRDTVLLAALCLTLAGCGPGGSGTIRAFAIDGAWVTSGAPATRGGLRLTGATQLKDSANGPLRGTLQLFGADGAETAELPVTGSLLPAGTGDAHPYWDLTSSTADGALSFSAAGDGVDSTSVIVGAFTDTRSGTAVSGRWHSRPFGGPSEPVIDRAYYQSGFSFLDLAWNGTKLLAVGAAVGGSIGVFELDTSGPALSATRVVTSPPLTSPSGIAWDGTRAWVVSAGPSFTFQLNAYDASWADALSGPPVQGPGGSPRDQPSWIAAWDGFLWSADVLNAGTTRIDPMTAEKTTVSSLVLDRTVGADFDGTSIWSATYPPGGVWPSLDGYGKAGNPVRSIYAPEDPVGVVVPVGVACETNGFIWAAYGGNLYRLDAR